MNNTLIIGTCIVLALCIVYLFIGLASTRKKITTTSARRMVAPRSLEELLNILNFTIEKEILFRLKIELELKRSTRVITKFNEELNGLSKNVLNALSLEYLSELNYYYKTDYILKYIVKTIQLYLIKYMDDNKINTK